MSENKEKPYICTGLWHPTPVLLPGKSRGRRSLVGCSPWGRQESDTTERLHFHFSLSCIGEGNGTPLQCSCLENPRDRGAWWAAVYGVAQNQTQLKWLSSRKKYKKGGRRKGQTDFFPPLFWYSRDLGVKWNLSFSKLKHNMAVKWVSVKLDCLGSNQALAKFCWMT